MTETSTSTDTTSTEGTSTDTSTATDDTNTVGTTDASTGAAREAQALRRRAREAEVERDRLAERVAASTRRDVVAVAGRYLAAGADLLDLTEHEVGDLLDADGNPDAAAIEAACAALVEARGERFAVAVKRADYDGGARRTATRSRTSWTSVLTGRPAARR